MDVYAFFFCIYCELISTFISFLTIFCSHSHAFSPTIKVSETRVAISFTQFRSDFNAALAMADDAEADEIEYEINCLLAYHEGFVTTSLAKMEEAKQDIQKHSKDMKDSLAVLKRKLRSKTSSPTKRRDTSSGPTGVTQTGGFMDEWIDVELVSCFL